MKQIKQFLARVLDLLLPPQPIATFTPETFLNNAKSALRAVPHIPSLPENTLAVFHYRNPLIKETVRALKYKNSRHAATLLAHGMYPHVLEYISDLLVFDADAHIVIIPIPLSAKRLQERGYNQARVLAEEIVKHHNGKELVLADDVLVRSRHTPPQTKTTSRKERLANVRGCFAIQKPDAVTGAHVIVIDDVITTGATVGEARRVLKARGARSVFVIAAAH